MERGVGDGVGVKRTEINLLLRERVIQSGVEVR